MILIRKTRNFTISYDIEKKQRKGHQKQGLWCLSGAVRAAKERSPDKISQF